MCFCGTILCAFYRKYEIYFSLYGYFLKSFNLKGIYSIILKFVEIISPTNRFAKFA